MYVFQESITGKVLITATISVLSLYASYEVLSPRNYFQDYSSQDLFILQKRLDNWKLKENIHQVCQRYDLVDGNITGLFEHLICDPEYKVA